MSKGYIKRLKARLAQAEADRDAAIENRDKMEVTLAYVKKRKTTYKEIISDFAKLMRETLGEYANKIYDVQGGLMNIENKLKRLDEKERETSAPVIDTKATL